MKAARVGGEGSGAQLHTVAKARPLSLTRPSGSPRGRGPQVRYPLRWRGIREEVLPEAEEGTPHGLSSRGEDGSARGHASQPPALPPADAAGKRKAVEMNGRDTETFHLYIHDVSDCSLSFSLPPYLPRSTRSLKTMCVCFITAGPITKLCAWGEEEIGGHVL